MRKLPLTEQFVAAAGMSVQEFADLHGIKVPTLGSHLRLGYCAWPRKTNHGLRDHYLYPTWRDIKARCLNPNCESHAIYGGRGIQICNRWRHSFVLFLEDVGDRPNGTTLDRIDPDGHYEPGNVRWATWSQQMQNRRPTTQYRGVTRTKAGTWVAAIRDAGRLRHLGTFRTAEEAAAAYDRRAVEIYGPLAQVNLKGDRNVGS